MKQIDFDHGTVTGNILGVALPMLVAQILSHFVQHCGSDLYCQDSISRNNRAWAVGLCFPIIVIITAFSNLFGSGGARYFQLTEAKGT